MSPRLTDTAKKPQIASRSTVELVLCGLLQVQIVGQVQAVTVFDHPLPEGEKTGELKGWAKSSAGNYQKLIATLQQQAKDLGANAVIALHFARQQRDWEKPLSELTATGTAVVLSNPPTALESPLVTTLTGQELLTLRQSGYWAVGCAIGVCTYRQKAHIRVDQRLGVGTNAPVNGEHREFSDAFDKVRNLALSRMQEEAVASQASGILSVTIETEVEPHVSGPKGERKIEHLVIHQIAFGTPVVEIRDGSSSVIDCHYALNLSK